MNDPAFTAGPGDEGLRLDAALAARGAVSSRSAAQRAIEAGRVTVDGAAVPKSHRLAGGERVKLEPLAAAAVVGDPAPEIVVVFEDEHLMVIDKPAGLVVHPARGHAGVTLAEMLAGRAVGGEDPARAGIVHRLDRDTSGLMIVAKSEGAHAALTRMLRRRELRREYLALVGGRPRSRSGTIDAPVGRDRANRTIHSTRTDRPRAAVTHFEIEESFGAATLLRVRLETGRTHQIRAHLAEIGLPVCGDAPYGGAGCGERLGLARPFLHSEKLMFGHPLTGEPLACESKPPADLRRAIEAARRVSVSEGPDGD